MSVLFVILLGALAWRVLGGLCVIAKRAKDAVIRLPERCPHGVPLLPDQPHRCTECERMRVAADADRQRQQEEARRRAENEKRGLAELRVKEAENIRQLDYLKKKEPISSRGS